MKVVLSGIFYPMAILRYFEAALKRRDDIDLFTVGPYTGTSIPWNHGMHLPQKYAKAPDLPLTGTQQAPISFVEAQLPWRPDLWIQVDAGYHFSGKPQYGKNAIVATDPHVLNYDKQRGLADLFYCMQACYAQAGDSYLPYAHDPIWHAPETQERLFDVCLLGLHYPNRNALVDRLRQEGVKVYYDLGPCFEEARQLYNQSLMGLNWSSLNDLTARVFELTGMGRLAVVNRVPDLSRFFTEGRDLVVFDSVDEAVERVLYYLEHEGEAELIADQGHETVKPHTWDARVDTILKDAAK